ncbi:MAG: hypothetical protein LBM77_08655, partial [Spirochaetaceae bacterium]|nr:hypothetical protein [Spirochaetaceae bacterium]
MRKYRHIGFAVVSLAALMIIYSCLPLGGISTKLALGGTIAINPRDNVIAGTSVAVDITNIEHKIKPQNYQWYYADSLEDIEAGNYTAIEGATEIAFYIPASGEVDY